MDLFGVQRVAFVANRVTKAVASVKMSSTGICSTSQSWRGDHHRSSAKRLRIAARDMVTHDLRRITV
jgi:hypothetical protein